MQAIWEMGDAAHWAFWTRWWEGVKQGRDLDWDLQRQVAEIDDAIWEAGAEAVNARIGEIIRDGARNIDEGPTRTAAQALNRNAQVVVQQLGVLRAFVTEEIERLRGRNSFYSSAEQEAHSGRIVQLTKIVEAVGLMEEALAANDVPGSTALAVIDVQLPQVIDAAEAAVVAGGEPEVSAAVVTMAATIKYLTDAGGNSALVTGYAFAEMCLKKCASWWKRK